LGRGDVRRRDDGSGGGGLGSSAWRRWKLREGLVRWLVELGSEGRGLFKDAARRWKLGGTRVEAGEAARGH
jgi:hypothetical protein